MVQTAAAAAAAGASPPLGSLEALGPPHLPLLLLLLLLLLLSGIGGWCCCQWCHHPLGLEVEASLPTPRSKGEPSRQRGPVLPGLLQPKQYESWLCPLLLLLLLRSSQLPARLVMVGWNKTTLSKGAQEARPPVRYSQV